MFFHCAIRTEDEINRNFFNISFTKTSFKIITTKKNVLS